MSVAFALQPIYYRNGSVLSYEVLARFPGLSTSHVIKHLEDHDNSSYLFDMQCFILEEAIDYVKKHLVPLWVNISMRSFTSKEYLSELLERILNAGVPKGYLGVEITETYILSDYRAIQDQLFRLSSIMHSLSYPLVLDDFAANPNCLCKLSICPFDYVKLSRDLIGVCLNGKKGWVALSKILGFLRVYDAKVIVEGVETQEMYHDLQNFEFDGFQGFYFHERDCMLVKPVRSMLKLPLEIYG
jgi:EAL domain-containing protein (putative c-di-GMP-specific phosphodiesterase class I)